MPRSRRRLIFAVELLRQRLSEGASAESEQSLATATGAGVDDRIAGAARELRGAKLAVHRWPYEYGLDGAGYDYDPAAGRAAVTVKPQGTIRHERQAAVAELRRRLRACLTSARSAT